MSSERKVLIFFQKQCENHFKSDPNKIVRNPVHNLFLFLIFKLQFSKYLLNKTNEYSLFSDVYFTFQLTFLVYFFSLLLIYFSVMTVLPQMGESNETTEANKRGLLYSLLFLHRSNVNLVHVFFRKFGNFTVSCKETALGNYQR